MVSNNFIYVLEEDKGRSAEQLVTDNYLHIQKLYILYLKIKNVFESE